MEQIKINNESLNVALRTVCLIASYYDGHDGIQLSQCRRPQFDCRRNNKRGISIDITRHFIYGRLCCKMQDQDEWRDAGPFIPSRSGKTRSLGTWQNIWNKNRRKFL